MKIKILMAAAAVACLVSCGTLRRAPSPSVRDSVRVEVVERVEYVTDTVFFSVPEIVERVVTRDTVSRLASVWARSEAKVSGGLLHHSLETVPRDVPVPAQGKVVYRDSVVYRDRVVRVPEPYAVEVPAELTRWQQFRIRSFFPLAALLVVPVVWRHRGGLLKFLARLIGYLRK